MPLLSERSRGRTEPAARSGCPSLRTGLIVLAAFCGLMVAVAAGWQPLLDGDAAVVRAGFSVATDHPWVARLGLLDARLQAPMASYLLLLFLAVGLRWSGKWVLALRVLAVPICVTIATTVLKVLVDRPRPIWVHPIDTLSDPSFPSGHASAAWALAVTALVVVRQLRRTSMPGRVLSALLVLAALLVAADRVLIGVHYPSDVVGGGLLGTAVALLLVSGVSPESRPQDDP